MVVGLLRPFFISVKLYNSAHFCPDFCNHLDTRIRQLTNHCNYQIVSTVEVFQRTESGIYDMEC